MVPQVENKILRRVHPVHPSEYQVKEVFGEGYESENIVVLGPFEASPKTERFIAELKRIIDEEGVDIQREHRFLTENGKGWVRRLVGGSESIFLLFHPLLGKGVARRN